MFLLFIFLEMPAIKLQITWQITNMTISTSDWFHVCREVGFFLFFTRTVGGKKDNGDSAVRKLNSTKKYVSCYMKFWF